ncbi:ATP12 family chaperone protein [Sphingomonas japonica]|uniref:Chaperone required for assembly of F1-ATPase n=1 Tax=Sphingomonas japonica TaxID=511662 RepID=A0ABX0TYB9_9SPHN|nr:ATP12 family protein [Sphingomonas japonica]NIJ23229.1 chaperone required for assembly of F1-ATPase [Sphingomonas japonica]
MKRFWNEVAVVLETGGYGIALDARPVRTPGRLPLLVPGIALAQAIAEEWRAVDGEIDPRAMRLTGLANAAVERIEPDPAPFLAGLAGYAETDLLAYRADGPEPLVERQATAWDPHLAWARARYDVHIETFAGVMHHPQPPATVARLQDALAARSPFELAALSPIVTLTGSLILGLALAERATDAETVWAAANLDADWQAELWGEDDLATATRAAHRAEYDGAVRFLALLEQPADEADQPGLA